jgi:transcriptional regulator with XRE-family HTH domain
MDSTKEGIRRNLVELLAKKDKRNSDLAKACGVGRSAVSNWISGESSIDIERIPTICEFLEVSIDEFFGNSKKYGRQVSDISEDETELLDLYRSMSPQGCKELMIYARGCVASYPKNQADSLGA